MYESAAVAMRCAVVMHCRAAARAYHNHCSHVTVWRNDLGMLCLSHSVKQGPVCKRVLTEILKGAGLLETADEPRSRRSAKPQRARLAPSSRSSPCTRSIPAAPSSRFHVRGRAAITARRPQHQSASASIATARPFQPPL